MPIDDTVTHLPVRNKRKEDRELFLVPPPAGKCEHRLTGFQVDVHGERCICRKCGEQVSPWFVLHELMKSESRWMRAHAEYHDEMKRLAERRSTKCRHCGEMTPISRR